MGNETSAPGNDQEEGGGGFMGSRPKMREIRPKGNTLFDWNPSLEDNNDRVKVKSMAHRKLIEGYLRRCFLFEDMSEPEMSAVIDVVFKKTVHLKDDLIEEGSFGNTLYMCHEGKFKFSQDGVELGQYNPGDHFGELSLIHSTFRVVTVTATTEPASVWCLHRESFRTAQAIYYRNHRTRLVDWFRQVPVLAKLRRGELNALVEMVQVTPYSAGQRVVKAGEESRKLFLVEKGKLLSVQDDVEYSDNGYFGEMSLLRGHLLESDVNATVHSTLVSLDVDTFEAALGPYLKLLEGHYNMAVLAQVPSLNKLAPSELRRLNAVLLPVKHPARTQLVNQTDSLNEMTLVVSGGPCYLRGPGAGGAQPEDLAANPDWDPDVRVLEAGEYFGHLSLLSEEKTTYSVQVGDTECEVLTLARADVVALFGPLHHLIITREHGPLATEALEADDDPQDPYVNADGSRLHWTIPEPPDIPFEELRSVAVLRSGTFHDLRLVQHRMSQSVFSLKSYSRHQLKRMGLELMADRDRTALLRVGDHPLVARMVNSYKNKKKLYILLEFVPGGELYHRIHPPPVPGQSQGASTGINEKAALFYAASVTLALGYLHSRDMVLRNLCPENVMLDGQGFIKLVDLESSKIVPLGDVAYTMVGTPEYMCPEMVLGRGHREGADWWALGVLVFEMLTGHTPFEDVPNRREDVVLKNIARHNLVMLPQIPELAQDLIDLLLQPHPARRLGCQLNGAADVQEHPWFQMSGLNFMDLSSMTTRTPFAPVLLSRTDFSHFPNAESAS